MKYEVWTELSEGSIQMAGQSQFISYSHMSEIPEWLSGIFFFDILFPIWLVYPESKLVN